MASHSTTRIPSLDGLRAVAIGLVLFAHLAGTPGSAFLPAFHLTGDVGNLGVRIFFVLSGFLITTLLAGELDATETIDFKRFYFRRTLRIFPAAYAYLAFAGAVGLFGVAKITQFDYLGAVTYSINFWTPSSWLVGHLWSLSVEEQFYLVWPFCLYLLKKRSASALCCIVLLSQPLVCLAWAMLRPQHPVPDPLSLINTSSLLAGALIALQSERLESLTWYQNLLRSRSFYAFPAVVFAFNLVPHIWYWMVFCLPIMNVSIAVCLDRWARYPNGSSGRFLQNPFVIFVGRLSYSMYLWQQPFLSKDPSVLLFPFPLNIAACFAAAFVSYRLIEAPCLSIRAKIERSWCDGSARFSGNLAREPISGD